jgi:mono/diheme cytochrome c family protein
MKVSTFHRLLALSVLATFGACDSDKRKAAQAAQAPQEAPTSAGAQATSAAPAIAASPATGSADASLKRLARKGRSVYRKNCESCHGKDGQGSGPGAKELAVKPRDFVRAEYKWRTTAVGELPTDADLFRTIERGAPGSGMEAWKGRLSKDDTRAVVQFIKTFSPRFAEEEALDPEDREPPVTIPNETPTLDAEAPERGKMLYTLMQCWTCHGPDGDGKGPAADTLKDGKGRPIRPQDFTKGIFKSGKSPRDLYRTIATGLNGTPMPSFHEALLAGREAFVGMSTFDAALDAPSRKRLRAYVARLPSGDDIERLTEDEQNSRATKLRWDLVAHVLSFSEGSTAWRRLWPETPPKP